jgi:hypothetical protein
MPGDVLRSTVRSAGIVAVAVCAALLGLAITVTAAQSPAAEPPTNDICLTCHGDPGAVSSAGRSVAVDETKFGESIHGLLGMACVDCHADLAANEDYPHAEDLEPVSCAMCHDGAVATYDLGIHAQARREEGSTVAATCVDCHTAHDIRPKSDPDSPSYALNIPATCARCHGSEEIIAAGHIAIGNVPALYDDSIHGRAVSRSGLLVAPNCTSCHGSHDIRQRTDPESRVNHANVPAICGSCHEGILRVYGTGVHGSGVASGNGGAPVCSDCHSAHGIQQADASQWQLDVIGECGTCHADQMRTYRDTFHGQVTSLGFTRVATCAACHGSHAIYPREDPRSAISSERLLETCQQCHETATEGFTRYDPHADKYDSERNPTLYWARFGMTWLLIGTFGFFGLHGLLWLPRGLIVKRKKMRERGGAPEPPEA